MNKLYLWDWAEVDEEGHGRVGARFENFVASQLLHYCHFQEDVNGHAMELRYIRDTTGREIDFVVTKNKKPVFAVECKSGDKTLSKDIPYFRDRLDIPIYYQVHLGSTSWKEEGVEVLPWEIFWKARVKEMVAED